MGINTNYIEQLVCFFREKDTGILIIGEVKLVEKVERNICYDGGIKHNKYTLCCLVTHWYVSMTGK